MWAEVQERWGVLPTSVHFWTEVGRAESGHPWTGKRAGLGAARFNLRPGLAVRIRPGEGPATHTHTLAFPPADQRSY